MPFSDSDYEILISAADALGPVGYEILAEQVRDVAERYGPYLTQEECTCPN